MNEKDIIDKINTDKGLTIVSSDKNKHLGGNFLEGSPHTYSPMVWDYIISRFAVRSVLDIGSGMGYAASYFFKKGMSVIAVDGMKENVDHAVYPTVQIDLTKDSINCNVDFVHCQEVVEHIEERYIDNLLSSLSSGKIILMTNALPNQGGYHHVNEQPTEYWIEQMKRYDCQVLIEDTRRIRKFAAIDGSRYIEKTGTIFANRKKLHIKI